MPAYRRIVVGTDLSPTAGVATERAAALARALGAELVLVHAGADPHGDLDELAARLGGRAVVEPGSPADVLVDACEELDADLLTVGSVGMRGARRFLLGSVPNKVSHHARVDLLIVKTDPPPRDPARAYGRILVGTDGSDTAMRAVDAAAALASDLGAALLVACAFDPPSERELDRLRADPSDVIGSWGAGRDVQRVPEEFRWRIAAAAQAEDVLDRAADRAAARGAEPEVRTLRGDPAEALLAAAEDEGFDLVVVGSVGMSGARRFALGNVPHRVSHHATVDVLVSRTA